MTPTIEIPDALYEELELAAAERHETLNHLILERISEPAGQTQKSKPAGRVSGSILWS